MGRVRILYETGLGASKASDEDFGMIAENDCVAAGLSGGKDSMVLLYALHLYRNF